MFSVGVRFGIGSHLSGTLADHVGGDLGPGWRVRTMARDCDLGRHRLLATWGSRNPGDAGETGYLGDQYFDYHRPGSLRRPRFADISDATWRAVGEDGLMLFHVVMTPSGDARLTVGLCLPAGGPDQIGILRPVRDGGQHA